MRKISKILLFTSVLLIFCIANVSATEIQTNDTSSETRIHKEKVVHESSTIQTDGETGKSKEITKTEDNNIKKESGSIDITSSNYNQYFETNESGKTKTTDNVKSGDTLNLQGTFNDLEFTVDKDNVVITSIGKSAKLQNCTVILQGPDVSNSKVTNMTIINTKNNCEGIILNNVSSVYVADNKVYVSGSNGFAFTSNTMRNSTVENNYFESNHTQTNMRIYASDNNQILNNTVIGYANGIYLCAYDEDTSNNNTIRNNTVTGKSSSSTCYTIQIMGSGNLVEENKVSGGYRGISSENSNTIRNNDVDAANTGIFTGDSSTIENNNIHVSNNSNGITVKGSGSIVRNNIIKCNDTGIIVSENDIIITNNTITSKKYSIYSKGYPKGYTGISINRNTLVGQVYNTGSMTLTDNSIKSSSAKDGGAIYNTGTMTVTNNIISSNTASANGGAVYTSGTLTLKNNEISQNSAGSGAVVYNKKGTITSSGNTFKNNSPASFEFKDEKITLVDTGNFIPENATVSIYEKSSLIKSVSMKNSVIDYSVPSGNHTYNLIVTNTSSSFDKNNFTYDYKELKQSTTTASVISTKVNDVQIFVKVTDKSDTSKTLPGSVIVYDQRSQKVGSGSLSSGAATIKLSRLDYSVDTCTLNVEYQGTSAYFKSRCTLSNVKFIRQQTKLAISTSKNTVTNTTVKATLTGTNDSVKLSGRSVSLTLPDKTILTQTTDANGIATFNVKNFTSGNKVVTARYNGEDMYTASSTTSTINILKETSKITASLQSVTTKNTTVKVRLTSPSTGKAVSGASIVITLRDSKKTIVKTDTNGYATVTFKNVDKGPAKLTFKYNGDATYSTSSATKSFTIYRTSSVNRVKCSNNIVRSVTLTGTVKDEMGNAVSEGSVVAKVGSKVVSSKVNVKNGKYILNLNIARTAKYNVSVYYNGSSYYTASTATLKNLNVKKIGSKFTTAKMVGKTVGYTRITAVLKDANGKYMANAGLSIKNSRGKVIKTAKTNSYGKISTPVSLSSGTQTLTIQYAGNNTYKAASSKLKVNVNKNNVRVTVSRVSGTIGEKVKLTATVKDSYGKAVTSGNLVFKLNGKTLKKDMTFNSTKAAYKLAVKNGKVTLSINADLYMSLNKKLTATYTGNSKYKNANSKAATCTVQKRSATIKVNAATKKSRTSTSVTLKATLNDTTKNTKNKTAIYEKTYVTFKVNGKVLKDAKGKTVKAYVNKNSVATYAYRITSKTKAKYTVTATFHGINYGTKSASTEFIA